MWILSSQRLDCIEQLWGLRVFPSMPPFLGTRKPDFLWRMTLFTVCSLNGPIYQGTILSPSQGTGIW